MRRTFNGTEYVTPRVYTFIGRIFGGGLKYNYYNLVYNFGVNLQVEIHRGIPPQGPHDLAHPRGPFSCKNRSNDSFFNARKSASQQEMVF
ncbi:MAG: hypothetical protein CM1200mP10_31980 [Candidatus Neomarinimicrobiota bacterium]|nr:MAG: hypothetical protein CM1200mP10_31980 [Candidatus Neomarinimicrobiota bacterium]